MRGRQAQRDGGLGLGQAGEKPVAMATEAADVVWTKRRREREVIFCLLMVFCDALGNLGVLCRTIYCIVTPNYPSSRVGAVFDRCFPP
jgi:hypothetical protein